MKSTFWRGRFGQSGLAADRFRRALTPSALPRSDITFSTRRCGTAEIRRCISARSTIDRSAHVGRWTLVHPKFLLHHGRQAVGLIRPRPARKQSCLFTTMTDVTVNQIRPWSGGAGYGSWCIAVNDFSLKERQSIGIRWLGTVIVFGSGSGLLPSRLAGRFARVRPDETAEQHAPFHTGSQGRLLIARICRRTHADNPVLMTFPLFR